MYPHELSKLHWGHPGRCRIQWGGRGEGRCPWGPVRLTGMDYIVAQTGVMGCCGLRMGYIPLGMADDWAVYIAVGVSWFCVSVCGPRLGPCPLVRIARARRSCNCSWCLASPIGPSYGPQLGICVLFCVMRFLCNCRSYGSRGFPGQLLSSHHPSLFRVSLQRDIDPSGYVGGTIGVACLCPI